MKRLSDLKRYYIDFMNNKIVEDPQGLYMDSLDVEKLVSELDDAFENCKMNLESAKATIEELKEQLNRMKRDDGTVEPDELEGFGGHGQW